MKLNYKLWLEEEDRLFGDGPWDILCRVDRLGSLSKAAAEIKMSYSQAWELINTLEERLGFKLIKSQVGGKAGGGSELTGKGRVLMETFGSFRREAEECLSRLEVKWFDDKFKKELGFNKGGD